MFFFDDVVHYFQFKSESSPSVAKIQHKLKKQQENVLKLKDSILLFKEFHPQKATYRKVPKMIYHH